MIVGEAHVVVRAITNSVGPEIRRAFQSRDIDRIGDDTGRRIGDGISRGIGRSGGGGGFFSGLASQADSARAQFDNLLRVGYTLGPALAGVAGAVSSLIGAFAGLASTVAGAIPALAAIPALIANIGIAGATLKLAFSGVGDAIGAGMRQAATGASGAAAATRDLTAELRRVKDAERAYAKAVADREEALARAAEERDRALTRLAEQQEASAKRLAQAQQDVTDAMAEGTEQVNDAIDRLANVEREASEDIYDAKKKVFEAQQNLNEAYAKAREEIEDLKFAAEDAALGEKKAALQLEKARETLLRVQDLPPNSRARREAELAFAQADLNYRKAIDTNKDLQKEQDRIAREGVDGTKTVQDAKKRLNDATEAQVRTEADAARSIADAQGDLVDAQIDAARRVSEAQAAAAQAQIEYDRDQRDAKWELIDIERRYADEQQAQNEAVAQAKRNLKQAEDDLAKARKEGYAGASGGANAYQQALANLSPEQRKFVEYMVNTFIPAIDDLRDASAKEFFPRLIPALENLRVNLFPVLIPLLTETGKQLGEIAKNVSSALTSPQVIDNIKSIWDSVNTKILPAASTIISNAVSIVSEVLAAAQPLVERFVGWIEKVTTGWKKMLGTEEGQANLQALLNRAGSIAAEIGGIIGDVMSGLGDIVKSQMSPDSGGYVMLRFFRDAAAAFKDFTSSPEGIARIEDFFKNTAANAKPILGFIGDLVKEFLKLGENPNIGAFFQSLRDADVAGTIGDIANTLIDAGPSIARFVENFVGFVKATTDSGAITTFWDTLSTILGKLRDIFQSPIMQQVLPIIGSIAAAGVALRTAWGPVKMVILAVADPLLKIGGILAQFNWARFIDDVKGVISIVGEGAGLFGKLKNLAILIGPQGLIVAAIAGLVLAFVAMWRESEVFRNAIKDLVDNVISKAVEIFNNLKIKLDEALQPLGGMSGIVDGLKAAFKFLGDIIGTYVIPVLSFIITLLMDVLAGAITAIIQILGILIRVFKAVWDGIYAAVEFVVKWFQETAWPIIKAVIDFIVGYYQFLWSIIKFVWDSIYAAIETVVNWFRDTVWPIIQTVIDNIKSGFEIMKGALETVWESIKGAIETVGNWLRDTLEPIVTGVWDKIKTGANLLWTKVQEVFGFIKDKINTVFSFVRDTALPIITGAFTTVKTAAGQVWDKIKDSFEFIKGKIETVFRWVKTNGITPVVEAFNTVKTKAGEIWTKVKEVFDNVQTKVDTVATKVKGFLSGLWDGLTSGLSGAFSTIKSVVSSIGRGINTMIDGFNKLPGPDIGRLPEPLFAAAAGGIVQPRPGGVMGIVAEAGRPERIEPLDPDGLSKRDKAMIQFLTGGSGGATINVYSQPGMDEVQLAKIVSREISFMMRKGSV